MHTLRRWIAPLTLLVLMALMVGTGLTVYSKALGGGTTTRVSVASDGTQGNDASFSPSLSEDGRFVVFESDANNLVGNDTNAATDVFVYDRHTLQTNRISVASNGNQSNADSYLSGIGQTTSITKDGRYITFTSEADNLVDNDANAESDIFLHDRQTGQTRLISMGFDGTPANEGSGNPSITTNGRYIAFISRASNLVFNDTNKSNDIFVYDIQLGQTSRVSIASDGTQSDENSFYAPAISPDGRYVAFNSIARNLVSNDTNLSQDIFVHDRETQQTTRVSVATDGTEGNVGSYELFISSDGRYVVFNSDASNLVMNDTNNVEDVFVHDRQTSQTTRVSFVEPGIEGNGDSTSPYISADGKYIIFGSAANNLISNDTNGVRDVFVYAQQTRQITRVSVGVNGNESNGLSGIGSLSADGRYVAFNSHANNLVTNDTNEVSDVFIREWGAMVPTVFIPVSLQNYAFTEIPCAALDSEPNNLFREADHNLSLCRDVTVTGAVSLNDTIDIYRIEVEGSSTTVQINLTNLPAGADYDLYLDAGPGNNLDYSTNAGSENESITHSLAPGRYYIRVVARADGNPNTYQLQWVRH